MELRRVANVGKFVLKLLHALLAGYLAWAFLFSLFSRESSSSWTDATGHSHTTTTTKPLEFDELAIGGICSVWFVVAIGMFFKNRWRWYPRAAAIVKTLLKVLNTGYAATCLGYLVWGSYHKPSENTPLWQILLCYLAGAVWLVCAIGLFFKKRWAWWGSTVLAIIPIPAFVGFLWWCANQSGGLFLIVLLFGGDVVMKFAFIPSLIILSFLLATRSDCLSKAMLPAPQLKSV